MKSFKPKIVDTYEDFLIYWSSANSAPLDQQIELWQASYMAKYSALLEKQIQNYDEENLDWREIAKEKVFPNLPERLPLMREARKNILSVYKPVCMKAHQKGELDFAMTFVIYVGVGCGASWQRGTKDNQQSFWDWKTLPNADGIQKKRFKDL